jgi:hypothetical protein
VVREGREGVARVMWEDTGRSLCSSHRLLKGLGRFFLRLPEHDRAAMEAATLFVFAPLLGAEREAGAGGGAGAGCEG